MLSMRPIINFLKKPTGQFIAIALFLAGVSYTARLVYVDKPREDEALRARSGADRIGEIAQALVKKFDTSEDPAALLNTLPELADWYPADLPCGRPTNLPKPSVFWADLGFKEAAETYYQYRFERRQGAFVLRARRDQDCDGLHVVHTLRGALQWPSAHVGNLETQNADE